MPDPSALLADLRAAGFGLRPDGSRLMIAPASQLSPEQDAAVRAHKPALLDLLRQEAEEAARLDAICEYDAGQDVLDEIVLLDARRRDSDPPRYVAVAHAHWKAYLDDLRHYGRLRRADAEKAVRQPKKGKKQAGLYKEEGAS